LGLLSKAKQQGGAFLKDAALGIVVAASELEYHKVKHNHYSTVL
jgi:hypothetical protein